MTARLRLFETWDASPEFAMGLDQALLEDPAEPPTLRFYTWSPPTLSLGYFQRLTDVAAAARAEAVVRRVTGGGAIHHANELTYSLVAPANDPLFAGPVADSYARIHRALAAGLREFGVRAELRGDLEPLSEAEGTGMCFHRSSALDLVWDGRKGVGSAQRRTGGRVLHHGSIKIAPSPLDTGVASLPDAPPPPVLAAVLTRALAAAFDLEPVPEEVGSELRRAADREGRRFTSPSWVGRR